LTTASPHPMLSVTTSVCCETFIIVMVKYMSVHSSITSIVVPMQVVSKLTLRYTPDLSCPSHLPRGECLFVVWGECEAENLLTEFSDGSLLHVDSPVPDGLVHWLVYLLMKPMTTLLPSCCSSASLTRRFNATSVTTVPNFVEIARKVAAEI